MKPSSLTSLGVLPALLLAVGASAAPVPTQASKDTVRSVRMWIDARNCDQAVDTLKAGLKRAHPEVMLLAGSMYENGICVRRDWSSAVPFYVQAFDAGLKEGAERLAAGYADPANGADVAAALWWSRQGRGAAFRGCDVGSAAAADPDRFVAELASWPQSRLATCNYIVGVMSTIAAEVQYPQQALDFSVGGDVTVRFLVDAARVEFKRGESRDYQLLGLVDGDALRDRRSKEVTGGFEKALGEVADRALRRFPQPKGIPPATVVHVTYQFSVTYDGA